MIEIRPGHIQNTDVVVPGSKSYTHRLLIAAALSDGQCRIHNPLRSEDTLLTMGALKQMGVHIHDTGDSITVQGTGGALGPCDRPIYLANSGTSMRLLTGVAALGMGPYTLTGSKRMHERPIQDLLDGLIPLGVDARSVNNDGCPPVIINGGHLKGGATSVRCRISSQFISSLLLMAPCTSEGVDIRVTEGLVSRPYVDMTIDIMEKLGIRVRRQAYERFRIAGGQPYRAGDYMVEPDCSQAGYFWAAAAITGAAIRVRGISATSRQGDVQFARVLEQMGCHVNYDQEGITVTGGPLRAVTVDMADMPDVVPTLAVVAAFARGTTVIENVAHLREKESDRLGTVAHELNRMGISAEVTDSGLTITGGAPGGAEIETYNDHRIAMSFAVAGLTVPGVKIRGEQCVEKSFPNYWDVFNSLYSRG